MNTENIFGKRIFKLRKSAEITQKQLGEAVGLSMQAINDIEKGRRETTFEKIIALANYFDVPVDYLLGRGVFENWDEIAKHKDDIIKQINKALPDSFQIINEPSIPDGLFMALAQCLLEKVEFHEDCVHLYFKGDNSEQADIAFSSKK